MSGPPAPEVRRSPARWLIASLVVCFVVVVATVVSAVITVPYYAITPGTGLDVASLISVAPGRATPHRGAVLLTDVELVPLRALTYLYYRYLDADADVEPNVDVTGYATAAEYDEQGVIDMGNARQAAAVNGLRALGYPIRAVPDGVIVYQPLPGSPAARALSVGEVVTAIDGSPTPTIAALDAELARLRAGAAVAVTTHTYAPSNAVTTPAAGGRAHVTRLRLGVVASVRDGVPICVARSTPGVAPPAKRACLGIESSLFEVEQAYAVRSAAVAVSIADDGIDGPSAGLAFTLGVIDKLDRDDLTGGHVVAATGTISMDGTVGPVGGVAQKTIAVRDAGATVFLVPAQEYATAKAHAGSSLHVYEVRTLSGALAILRSLGGRIAR